MLIKLFSLFFGGAAKQVTADLLKNWIESVDLEDNHIAYDVLTTKPLDGYVPSERDAAFLLEYLLACIVADVGWESNTPHNKPEALWELQTPLTEIWNCPGTAMPADAYWDRITRFLMSKHPEYDDDFVTHFLEACEFDQPFRQTMKQWQEMPGLKRYVTELSAIVGERF